MSNLLRTTIGRFWPFFLIVALEGALLGVTRVAMSQPGPADGTTQEAFFANFDGVGVAATVWTVYATGPECGTTRRVVKIVNGNVRTFANLPNRASATSCSEDYLTTVPTPQTPSPQAIPGGPTPNNGFLSNDVLVALGGAADTKIVKLTPNYFSPDSPPTLADFGTLPSSCKASGITFANEGPSGPAPTGGPFGHHAVVTCKNTEIWLFNSSGQTVKPNGTTTSSPIATICQVDGSPCSPQGPAEGPVVTPVCEQFSESTCVVSGRFAGNLLVALENAATSICTGYTCTPGTSGQVWAVTPSGVSFPVGNINSVESMTIVPKTKCTHALTAGLTYFSAIHPASPGVRAGIYSLAMPNFTTFAFNALGASENGEDGTGIGRLSAPNVVTRFRDFFGHHQGTSFVNCRVPGLLSGVTRTPQVIKVTDTTVTLRIPSQRWLNWGKSNLLSITYGKTGTEHSILLTGCQKVQRGEKGEGGKDKEGKDKEKEKAEGSKDKEKDDGDKDNEKPEAGEGPAQQCTATTALLGIPPTEFPFRGHLIVKLSYTDPSDPTGDGCAENGG